MKAGWYILTTAPAGPAPVYVHAVNSQRAFYYRLQPEADAPRIYQGDAPLSDFRPVTGERLIVEVALTPGCKMFSAN